MFDRTLKIMDKGLFDVIQKQKILLVGVGGVGGFALESLVRLGFLNITIVDGDVIDESNLNRQIISTRENIGNEKVLEAKKRALSIQPEAVIKTYKLFLLEDNLGEVLVSDYDYIVDACDTITTKCLLIQEAQKRNIPIISCMGMGNRFNPGLVTITKLNKTYNDPLAKTMRTILRKNNLPLNINVVWSSEIPVKRQEKTPGSLVLVPASAGLEIAFFILNDLKNRV